MRSIAELVTRLREGATTSQEVTAECLDRIAQANSRLNAFITVMAESARAAARQADEELKAGRDRGLLHGVPISLKDLIDVEGVPTTAASRVLSGSVARRDAPVVTRLKDAGAVIIGKTNLHEFAYGPTSDESAFGPVRHPVDPTRVAGGSSGGSAVAVATGMCVASIGTDTGGSIRIPAALCGIVGLKPSAGDVSCDGVIPLSRSLDNVGPLAGSVADARILFIAIAYLHQRPQPVVARQPRIGVLTPYFLDTLDEQVRRRFSEAVDRLRAAGANVDEVAVPHASLTSAAYAHIVIPEASAYHAATLERQPDAYHRNVRLRLEAGRYLRAEDYVRAQHARSLLRNEVDALLRDRDGLILPTTAIAAPPVGAAEVDVCGRSQPVRNMVLRLTQLFNLTGHPAISIPAGVTKEGLPVGLQIVGHHGETARLLDLAEMCERWLDVRKS